jgi:uncharacterized RDD family membrane protein YckC
MGIRGGSGTVAVVNLGHLRASEALAGRPLAPRWRRAAAFAVDGILIFLPAVAVALGVALLSLRHSDPTAFSALKVLWRSESRAPQEVRKAWGDLAPLLIRVGTPDLPDGLREAVAHGDREHAAGLLEGHDLLFSLALGEREEMRLPEKTLAFPVEKLIPKPVRALVVYGVMALYFTLFTASKRGATPGKRLLRLRVASLEGGKVPLLESLERFAGYIEIPATLGFALFALWRDPNRRLPHDRVAGTLVLLERPRPATPAASGEEAPPAPEALEDGRPGDAEEPGRPGGQ